MEIRNREQWRAERVEKAFKIVATIIDMDEAQLRALLYSLEDIQGHLKVNWRHPMTSTQCKAFDTAWALCGEKDQTTSHHVFW